MQILYTCIYLQELFSYRKKNHRFYVYCEGNSWNILKCKTTKVCLMKSPNILRTRCEKVFFKEIVNPCLLTNLKKRNVKYFLFDRKLRQVKPNSLNPFTDDGLSFCKV